MASFLFVLSHGPEDTVRSVRCLFLARLAAEKGHKVTVFLLDDAVYWTNLKMAENVTIPTGDALIGQIMGLQKKGVRFLVCKPCAESRQIALDHLPDGFEPGTGGMLIDIAADAKVLTF